MVVCAFDLAKTCDFNLDYYTFKVRGVTYSVNIDLHMQWTKQDRWEICEMNI